MVEEYWNLSRYKMEQIEREKTLVLIPLGALEQHGNQAPLGTDSMIADEMINRILPALKSKEEDGLLHGNVLIFPVIPIGFSVEHMNFCGSVSFKADTYYHLLYDIVESLHSHGFKHVAFLLCHGGNKATSEIVSRQLRHDLGVYVYLISSGAFSHEAVKATLTPGNEADFHGGEMETSMVMARDESLVDLTVAEEGKYGKKNGKLSFTGSVALPWMGEDFITNDGKPIGIGGNPGGASAEKGDIILNISAIEVVEGILDIMRQICPINAHFVWKPEKRKVVPSTDFSRI